MFLFTMPPYRTKCIWVVIINLDSRYLAAFYALHKVFGCTTNRKYVFLDILHHSNPNYGCMEAN